MLNKLFKQAKLENEVHHLRNRVSTLQADLETSEAVQRDFVQLSQQLQVINQLSISIPGLHDSSHSCM